MEHNSIIVSNLTKKFSFSVKNPASGELLLKNTFHKYFLSEDLYA